MKEPTNPGIADGSCLQLAMAAMNAVRDSHPEWYENYQDVDPMICPQAQLQELVNTSPTDMLKGIVVGIFLFRQQMAILTGRAFQ